MNPLSSSSLGGIIACWDKHQTGYPCLENTFLDFQYLFYCTREVGLCIL